jgi:hypothetical protein
MHFDFFKSRILHVDSSKYALSAVLSQHDASGTLQPVSFFSNKWTEKESLWQCHDQELGAIVQAFVEWRAWLINTREPVEVFLDHANLKYFTSNQNLLDRQAQWAAFLSSFNFVIKHIPGRLNPADPPTFAPIMFPQMKWITRSGPSSFPRGTAFEFKGPLWTSRIPGLMLGKLLSLLSPP